MNMQIKMTHLIVAFLILYLAGCNLSDRGFHFYGEYEATQSGYRIQVISQGYVEPGDDLANAAFARVRFCPVKNTDGSMFLTDLTLKPREWIHLNCEVFGDSFKDLNWKTSERLLTDILSRAGYQNLVTEEVQRTAKVIMNSLSGPKGVILEGQIKSLKVVHTDIQYGYKVLKDQAPNTWIEPAEVPACGK